MTEIDEQLFPFPGKSSRATFTPTRTTVKIGVNDHDFGDRMWTAACIVRELLGEITCSMRGKVQLDGGGFHFNLYNNNLTVQRHFRVSYDGQIIRETKGPPR